LSRAVTEKRFREDLYYRLNALELTVPPLRERGGDLLLLVEHFLRAFAPTEKPPRLTTRALLALTEYRFPGNVRELRHAIQSAVVLAGEQELDLHHLPAAIAGTAPASAPEAESIKPLPEAVRAFEREYVKRVVQQTGGKRSAAAQLLGISRKNLWEKLKGFGFTELELASLAKDDTTHDEG
jgi:DNA-binding NtrC family response regulator